MERAVKLAISREKLVTEDSYAGIFRSITGSEKLRIASRSHAYSLLGERERVREVIERCGVGFERFASC